jgi:hypothetical protein
MARHNHCCSCCNSEPIIEELRARADQLADLAAIREAHVARRRAEAEQAVLELEARRIAEENRLNELFGDDVFSNGDVITFEKKYLARGRTYVYVALKSGGCWYLTGPQQSGLVYDWRGLCKFVLRGIGSYTQADVDVKLWRVSEWEEVLP